MTDEEMLAELERLNAERTEGEWFWREDRVDEDDSVMRTLAPGILILDDCGGGPWGDEIDCVNAAFIVISANAMPRLLALARAGLASAEREKRLREANECAGEELLRIQQWCDSYPVDIFRPVPPDDLKRAHALLAEIGISMDAMHAGWARYVLDGVAKYAAAGLAALSGQGYGAHD